MPDLVKCGKGCSDCCYALFDVTLVEAMYINAKFNEKFSGLERSAILDRADKADREIHKLKRKVYKASPGRVRPVPTISFWKWPRPGCAVPCSAMTTCALSMSSRPITCRLVRRAHRPSAARPHTCHIGGLQGRREVSHREHGHRPGQVCLNIGKELQDRHRLAVQANWARCSCPFPWPSSPISTRRISAWAAKTKLTVQREEHAERELGKETPRGHGCSIAGGRRKPGQVRGLRLLYRVQVLVRHLWRVPSFWAAGRNSHDQDRELRGHVRTTRSRPASGSCTKRCRLPASQVRGPHGL